MEKKVCSKCGLEKPKTTEYFEKRKNSKDGFRNQCKDCRNAKRRDRYTKCDNWEWREWEINILKKYYETKDTRYICENFLPNRTVEKITDYATKKLGLKKKKGRKYCRVINGKLYGWTEKEENFLRENYYTLDRKQICNKLKKDWDSIKSKAINLDLRIMNKDIDTTIKLAEYIRRRLKWWVQESLTKNNNKCWVTGVSEELEVHHFYNFKKVLLNILDKNNIPIRYEIKEYSKTELDIILKECIEYHKNNLGIPLNKTIHKEFHSRYGSHDNNMNQLIEFKKNYNKINTL